MLLKFRVELLCLGIGAEPDDLHGTGEDVTGNALLIHPDAFEVGHRTRVHEGSAPGGVVRL